MKQDMELIKLILQTLADNENYFMLSDNLAKQIQVKTKEKDAFNNKFIGHFFLAKDANLISEMSVFFHRTRLRQSPDSQWRKGSDNCSRT